MAHYLMWPKTFFHPFGDMAPVHLTEYIPPERPADLLLLGFRDPINMLFTVHTESEAVNISRKLDFTCCDSEPAVLELWPLFFDFFLTQASFDIIVSQCRKRLKILKSSQSWRRSKSGSQFKMSTRDTLQQLRHHWMRYTEFAHLSSGKKDEAKRTFLTDMQDTRALCDDDCLMAVMRSAGLYSRDALPAVSEHFNHLWSPGVHSMKFADFEGATLVNPTPFYSASGNGFFVHKVTNGLVLFHLAEVACRSWSSKSTGGKKLPSSKDLVDVAQSQFKDWCNSFRTAAPMGRSRVVFRFFVGDALNLCRAFHHRASTSSNYQGVYCGVHRFLPPYSNLTPTNTPTIRQSARLSHST
ncbi:hypothetical protein BV25DRAFT_1835327 [Artomyces pyxidatus]|uniref:Uncharacterized protein n=1 Tax=Artomyces pyxidatus TaxID=48021 RepID=A0ACB8TEY3_9AGAM|nr:hypothetical protein BV25DRAFT_1835327 [Artomyces pyxidatus]